MKKNGVDKYFAPEYEVKIKNIKTGEHYQDRHGKHYTVVSVPAISSKDRKELALVCWENEDVISFNKESLITHLNIIGAEKIEECVYPRHLAYIDNERSIFYEVGKGAIYHLINVQNYTAQCRVSK